MRPDERTNRIPEHIERLAQEKRKVYIKGYMHHARQMHGIQSFLLVRTKEHCKICQTRLSSYDMIHVHCLGDLRVPFRLKPIHVGGQLFINENPHHGQPAYFIYADLVR